MSDSLEFDDVDIDVDFCIQNSDDAYKTTNVATDTKPSSDL